MEISRFNYLFDLDKQRYLIINSATYSVDIIDKCFYKNLSSNNFNSAYVDTLIQRGYIIQNAEVDDNRIRRCVSKGYNPSRATFFICPTYDCNLRCPYCFEPAAIHSNSAIITENNLRNLFSAIEHIIQTKNIEKTTLLLYGGEPLLPSTIKVVKRIMEYAKCNNFKLQAITNGSNIIEYYSEIIEQYSKIFSSIQFTLDGYRDDHNQSKITYNGKKTFDIIVNAIDFCVNIGLPVVVRINTTNRSLQKLPMLLHMFEEKGWTYKKNWACQLVPITDCSNYKSERFSLFYNMINMFGSDIIPIREHYHMFFESSIERCTSILSGLFKKNVSYKHLNATPCFASTRSFYVFGPEGKIYACPKTVGIPEYAIGEYSPNLFIDQKEESLWRRDVTNIEKCFRCPVSGLCAGGCVWSSIKENGKEFLSPKCLCSEKIINKFFSIIKEKLVQKYIE